MNPTFGDWRPLKALQAVPRLASVLPIYLLIYSICYFAAYLLRFDFVLKITAVETFQITLPALLLVKCGVSLLTREWRRRHRFTTLDDVLYLAAGATASAVLIYLCNLVEFPWKPIPRSVILIDCVLAILTISVLRMAIRLSVETANAPTSRREKKRTIIYGASNAGIAILRTIQASNSEYKVAGFIDDSVTSNEAMIAGVPVFAAGSGLEQAARSLHAKHVLIPSSLPGKRVRELLVSCQKANLTAHVIPAVHEIVDGRYKLEIRDVTISDLLRRDATQLDFEQIRGYITGRRVLVTGASGSIGSELCRQILALEPERLVLLDQSESGIFEIQQELLANDAAANNLHFEIADVGNEEAVARIFDEHDPQLMFHAAAYKHVPLMEANPDTAIRNNVFGTKNAVDLADQYGVERFVLISTDKAVRPTSIMGATKLVAEKYLQAVASRSKTRFITVRFGNVLNSVGSVVPTFRRQILEGGPVTVTDPDMVRYFMTIPEAVQLVLQAGAIGASGDVLILDMGNPVKIVDLAKDMIYLSGLKYPDDIDIVFTGLRPGEKLYEELFYGCEEGASKVHEKIFCAARDGVSLPHVMTRMHQLQNAIHDPGADSAETLNQIVAEFVLSDEAVPVTLRQAA